MRLSVCFLTLDIHMDMQQPLALAPSFNNDKVSEVAAPGCATSLYLLSQRNLYTREGSKDHQGEATERRHNVAGFSTGNGEMGRDTFR